MRRALAALLLALLPALPALPADAGPGDGASVVTAHWGAGVPEEAAPGDTARTLTVEFMNVDSTSFNRLEAQLQLPQDGSVRATYQGSANASAAMTLRSGDTWNATFTVDLGAQLPVGTLGLTVLLDMHDTASTNEYFNYFDVAVPLTGRSHLLVEPGMLVLPPNAPVTVPVQVRNDGQAYATGIKLTFTGDTSGLLVASQGNEEDVPSLGPNQSATVHVDLITPAQPGNYALAAALAYTNAAGAQVSAARTLGFRVAAPTAGPLNVSLAGYNLPAGQATVLRFTVTNTGSVPVRMVSGTFHLPAGIIPLNASDTPVLGDLAPGQGAPMPVEVFTSRSANDVYDVSLNLSWQDAQGFQHGQGYDFGVLVQGTVLLGVSGASASVDNGTGQAIISGTLTNTGLSTAHNAYVSVAGSALLAPSAPSFLGDIDANSPLPFSVTTRLAGNLTGGFRGGRGNFTGNFTGRGGFGNGTGAADQGAPGGAGFPGGFPGGGGFRGGPQVTLVFTWNDDYGQTVSQNVSAQVQLRPASAAARGTAATASRGLPGFEAALLLAAVGAALLLARRRG